MCVCVCERERERDRERERAFDSFDDTLLINWSEIVRKILFFNKYNIKGDPVTDNGVI